MKNMYFLLGKGILVASEPSVVFEMIFKTYTHVVSCAHGAQISVHNFTSRMCVRAKLRVCAIARARETARAGGARKFTEKYIY